jgi:hypothetical protein
MTEGRPKMGRTPPAANKIRNSTNCSNVKSTFLIKGLLQIGFDGLSCPHSDLKAFSAMV